MSNKKQYSTKAFLTEEEFKQFTEFLKDTGISPREMANIEGEGKRKETMNARLRKKRIRRAFANKIIEAKELQAKETIEKFKGLRF